MAKPKMEFYDVKTKGKFSTDAYRVVEKGGRFFAVASQMQGLTNVGEYSPKTKLQSSSKRAPHFYFLEQFK